MLTKYGGTMLYRKQNMAYEPLANVTLQRVSDVWKMAISCLAMAKYSLAGRRKRRAWEAGVAGGKLSGSCDGEICWLYRISGSPLAKAANIIPLHHLHSTRRKLAELALRRRRTSGAAGLRMYLSLTVVAAAASHGDDGAARRRNERRT